MEGPLSTFGFYNMAITLFYRGKIRVCLFKVTFPFSIFIFIIPYSQTAIEVLREVLRKRNDHFESHLALAYCYKWDTSPSIAVSQPSLYIYTESCQISDVMMAALTSLCTTNRTTYMHYNSKLSLLTTGAISTWHTQSSRYRSTTLLIITNQ